MFRGRQRHLSGMTLALEHNNNNSNNNNNNNNNMRFQKYPNSYGRDASTSYLLANRVPTFLLKFSG